MSDCRIFRGLLVLIALALPALAAAQDGRRVALVLGNAAYEAEVPLRNPGNDAREMAAALERLGFEVTLATDQAQSASLDTIEGFVRTAVDAEIALFYYSGHGLQLDDANYLLPVDLDVTSPSSVQYRALDAGLILADLEAVAQTSIMILDACRDNPFATTMQRNNGTRSLRRGLAPVNVEGEQGLVVSFAAQEGSTAEDGAGGNSPYTAALLEVIDEPGLEVGRMFRKVRAKVREATNGAQVPVERMQLPDKAIYFVAEGAAVPAPPPPSRPAPGPVERDPMAVYLDAVTSGELEPLIDFVSRYPDHPRAEDARKLIALMQDDAFWAQVNEENTVLAYRRYVIAFPEGQHVNEALARIAALSEPEKPAPAPPPISNPSPPPAASVRPSFDCNKASTAVERAICSSADLARQDNDLLDAYNRARGNGWVSRTNQVSWIKQRGAACNGVGWRVADCVQTVSGDRINALRAGRLSGNVAPGFNCSRASTAVERAICSSDVLGRQDQLLLQLYKSARSRNTSAARAQSSWIRSRESRCGGHSDVAWCVAAYTADRMIALSR